MANLDPELTVIGAIDRLFKATTDARVRHRIIGYATDLAASMEKRDGYVAPARPTPPLQPLRFFRGAARIYHCSNCGKRGHTKPRCPKRTTPNGAPWPKRTP